MRNMMYVGLCGILTAGLLSGCAVLGGGPSDEELVMQQVQAFTADFLAANTDNLLNYISEDFENERVPGGKAEVAQHLEDAKAQGRVEEFKAFVENNHGEIDLADAEVTIENGIATVYPILASADLGAVTVELSLKKDPDKIWRIAGIYIEGI